MGMPTDPTNPPEAPPETPPEAPPEPVKLDMTQADLDRIIADRLARDRAKHADYDELKAKAAKLDEIEEAQKSELEKLQDQLAENQRKAAEAQAERDGAIIQNAVLVEAGKQGVPQDRLGAALKLLDTNMLSVEDDGTVTGVQEAVKAMLEANAFLIGDGTTPPSTDAGAGSGERPGKTVTLTPEEKKLARLSNMTEEEYLKYKTNREGWYAEPPQPKE